MIFAKNLEHWWVGHAIELSQNNLSVNRLRDESHKLSGQLESQAAKCLQTWVDAIYPTEIP